jgi:two-component system alkaline phosphatase synthesis response regulator PhoP
MIMATAARKTVLIVDDEQSMLKVLERRLTSWGYEVLLAENGQEGLRLAAERRPHLILLDVMMPAPDGLEVARQLKADRATARIPIILVTVKATQLSPEEIKASRAFRVIGKPYESEELEDAVRAALA